MKAFKGPSSQKLSYDIRSSRGGLLIGVVVMVLEVVLVVLGVVLVVLEVVLV